MERVEEEIVVSNDQGLHARPAAEFVQLASKFDSSVRVGKDEQWVDGKSIIALLSLGASKGTKIKLVVEGEDAPQAFEELKKFLGGRYND